MSSLRAAFVTKAPGYRGLAAVTSLAFPAGD